MTRHTYTCRVRSDNVVEIRRENGFERLEISFKHTVRVPDNSDKSDLPPDMGTFPLYKTEQYAQSLPDSIVAKRGIFLPMYQREAMWLNFEASGPFAVKIYAGSINVVSGEPIAESHETKLRRQAFLSRNQCLQDYIVVPGQKWLDGFATSDGVVRQFIATKLGDGYTVEAQFTGQEVYGGLQIEITPAIVNIKSGQKTFSIVVQYCTTGEYYRFPFDSRTTVRDLQTVIHGILGMPVYKQRLMYWGERMRDDETIFAYTGACENELVVLSEWLIGGGPGPSPEEIGLAAGGSIKQAIVPDEFPAANWHKSATIVFNAQLLDAASFEAVTGVPAPETPITMETYANLGLPFFKLHEEQSDVHGSFEQVKSVGEIEGTQEQTVNVPVININKATAANPSDDTMKDSPDTEPTDITNPAGPLQEFRSITEVEKDLQDLKLADSRGREGWDDGNSAKAPDCATC
ncbi:hypothetical protein PV11_03011 [Exophiala sideris]|uniref:Ubiquitin-like domain-containing protein n=1 Tax=Exophiala sideris TaxID=1016849 RepID=A0A0D1ZL03_9EURO|nr:hypothetical protein PV11_03011 [Exophiala sideris]